MMKIMMAILKKVTLMFKIRMTIGDTQAQPDRLESALDTCPMWTAIMIMLVMVVTIMFNVLMTRYNLTGWTQLLKCASPIFHPQHQVINVLVCGNLLLGTRCLGVCTSGICECIFGILECFPLC